MHPLLWTYVFSSPIIAAAYFGVSLLIGIVGRNRTMGFWGYFFGSIILTPMIGLLLFLVSAKKRSENSE